MICLASVMICGSASTRIPASVALACPAVTENNVSNEACSIFQGERRTIGQLTSRCVTPLRHLVRAPRGGKNPLSSPKIQNEAN